MENKEFKFQGLDAKTEVRLAMLMIVPALIIMLGTLYLSYRLVPNVSYSPILFAAIITVSASVLILKFTVRQIKERDRQWMIRIGTSENIIVTFRDHIYSFNMREILMVKNLGNTGVRYLTLKTRDTVLKIRVGNSVFAPFSTERDIMVLDTFVDHIKPYIIKHFETKVLKNAMNPYIIPNFGVFIKKGEKIKYSLINKLNPWQVIALIMCIGIILMIIFMKVMEYVF